MKVGEYIRTDDGLIGKVVSEPYEYKDSIVCDIDFGNNDIYNEYEMYQSIIKSSPNIIDLIEIGDYVNGIKISSVYDDDKEANDYNLKHKKCLGTNVYDEDYQEKLIYEEDIKFVVTKEQFSQMEYRIGE